MTSSQTLPDPETIRRTAQEVIQRPEYQVDKSADGAALWDLILRGLYWLLQPFRWLMELMSGLPFALRLLIVIGLVVLLVLLVAHIVYTFVRALRGTKNRGALQSDDEDSAPDPELLEMEAESAVARHDYVGAVRLLLRASLLRLEQQEQRKYRPGITNREHLRRLRAKPFVDSLAVLVETVDTKWYGPGDCRREDYERCRDAYLRIVEQLKAQTHVDVA